MIVAIVTFLIAVRFPQKQRDFSKLFLSDCHSWRLCVVTMPGLVDFQAVVNAKWLSFPDFILPFKLEISAPITCISVRNACDFYRLHWLRFRAYRRSYGTWKNLRRNFLKDPGLEAYADGRFGQKLQFLPSLGVSKNTTYGENTGVIGMTKISSVYVTGGAACIAILLSCVGRFRLYLNDSRLYWEA